jgi:hypothetical protein
MEFLIEAPIDAQPHDLPVSASITISRASKKLSMRDNIEFLGVTNAGTAAFYWSALRQTQDFEKC